MGMFDDVQCDAPLPDGHNGSFQTKDLGCDLSTYRITADGRLLLVRWDSEARAYHADADQNLHGMLNFYGSGPGGVWHEYNAKFTDGQLVCIVQVPDTEALAEQSIPSTTVNALDAGKGES